MDVESPGLIEDEEEEASLQTEGLHWVIVTLNVVFIHLDQQPQSRHAKAAP